MMLASVLTLATGACGGGDESSRVSMTIETPATLVGDLDVSVEKGPVGDADLSEVNFGSVTTDEGVVLNAIPADVARSSGVTREALVAGGPDEVGFVGVSTIVGPDAPTHLGGSLVAIDE